MSPPLDQSACTLASRVRDGDLSPVDLVDLHIRRIESVDPLLNAMTARRFEQARSEARAAAERLAAARRAGEAPPPLLGVPCTIKEFIAVEGLPHTGAILRLKGRVATADAEATRRVRAAGAIVLGATNAPEGGLWMETVNLISGRTKNPWDLTRTPGGSSGGEGAIVAAGGAPFGLGSDVGGSIRIPAAFCGVPGHKPTGGRVPNTGHFPPAAARGDALLCIGPLARRVEDLRLLTAILSVPVGAPLPSLDGGPVDDLRGLRVVSMPTEGVLEPRPVVAEAVRRAAAALESRGARVVEARLPALKSAVAIWSAVLSEAADTHYDEILGGEDGLSVLAELWRMPFGRARHSFPAVALTALDKATRPFSRFTRRFLAAGAALREELDALLGADGVLLHPPYSRPAPRHNDPWRTPFDFGCTAIFNMTESPVTVVPMGFESRGLPLAVQVVGARRQDALTLRAAAAIEADVGGWVRAEPRVP